MSNYEQQVETMKYAADAGAAGISLGAIMGLLPHITAVLSLVWVAIRLYETKTIQSLIAKLRKKNDPRV